MKYVASGSADKFTTLPALGPVEAAAQVAYGNSEICQ
jgi:hypothetical protein